MSDKNGSQAFAPKSINTLVGAGMRIEGDIACTGVLRVQGEIVGNVSSTDKGDATLMVDSAGSVTGAVSAAHVSVRGRIAGPVQSRQTIEVHQGGSIAGDISFNQIAIHAGGVVDGMFTPVVVKKVPKTEAEKASAVAGSQKSPRPGTRKIALAVAAVAIVSGGVWIARHPEILARSSGDEAALKTDAALNPPLTSQSAPAIAAASPPPRQPEPAVAPAASAAPVTATPAPSASVAAQEAAPPSEAAEKEKPQEKTQEKVVSVRGINPNRPAGVFLLISNEPSILYRKKRDETGEGAKVSVPAGEKASVAIARDELIRVAHGSDVVILFQGAKVPRNIIESGSWISFAPK